MASAVSACFSSPIMPHKAKVHAAIPHAPSSLSFPRGAPSRQSRRMKKYRVNMSIIPVDEPRRPYDVLTSIQEKLAGMCDALNVKLSDALLSVLNDGAVKDANADVLNALQTLPKAGVLMNATVLDAVRWVLDARDKLEDVSNLLGEAKEFPGAMRKPWDFKDEEYEVKIRIDVPGLSEKEVNAHWEEEQVLIITCSKPQEQGDEEWLGPPFGPSYLLELPWKCKKDGLKTKVKNGVLILSIPKGEAQRLDQ